MSEDSKKKQRSIGDFFLKTSTRPWTSASIPQTSEAVDVDSRCGTSGSVGKIPGEKQKPSGDIGDQRKEGSPKTNMLDIVGDNRNKAIPLAVHSTKSRKFCVMAERIGDGSHFESSSSKSDNVPGELLAGTVNFADKIGGDTKHKRKKAGPKKREVEGVAVTSDTGSNSSESELEELLNSTIGDVDKRKTGAGSKRKRTQAAPKRQSFVCSWEQDEELKHFVVRSPYDGKTAWCKFCCKTLKGSKYNMVVHSQRGTHKENVKMDGSQMPLNPLFESALQKRQAVSLCEMRLVAWFAAEDVPFKKADSLTPVLKASVPDSSILRQVKLKRTKVKGVIHDLMAPHECQTLADLLTRAHYSLIVDETTDKSSAKALVMIAKYKHHATLLVKEEFLGLVEVTDASSKGQKELIQTYLKDIGVPFSNLIGIAYDNASVNTGVHGGLGALFQESSPHLFTLGCTSHSLALCASYASKFLPDGLELFLKDLINYVAGSPKRIAELNHIQEFLQSTHYKLLQIAHTRWLSLEAAIRRVLEVWSPLVTFFVKQSKETSADKASKDKASKILAYMKEPTTKAYLYFLAFVLGKVNALNVQFQSGDTMIHTLITSFRSTLTAIMRCFVKLEILSRSDAFELPLDPRNYKDVKDVLCGPNTEAYLNEEGASGKAVEQFKLTCLGFYVELVKQMRKRVNHKDKTLQALEYLDPKVAVNGTVETISPLTIRFSKLLGKSQSEIESARDTLENQWQSLPDSKEEMILKSGGEELMSSPSYFWKLLSDVKNPDGTPKFFELSNFMLNLCALPHSSAGAERQFSQLTNIKTNLRNRLEIKTVDSLMHVKQMVTRSAGSVDRWQIPPPLLNNFSRWYCKADDKDEQIDNE